MNINAIHSSNVNNTFNSGNPTQHNSNFEEYITNALNDLNNSQILVAENQKKFINGEIEAHELMTNVAESEYALKITSSIASKLISGIQELTNMQI